MKNAAIAALLLASSAAKMNKEDQAYVQIVKGYLKGSINADGFTDIASCIQDGEKIYADAQDAYQHLQKLDIQDI